MGRIAKQIDLEALKSAYNEYGSIKVLAKMFHKSNNGITDLLKSCGVKVKGIGNKIDLSNKTVSSIIKDYVSKHMKISEICEKYDLKYDKVSEILSSNGVETNRWNGHIKKVNVSRISFLNKIISLLDENGIEYELNRKINNNCTVGLVAGDIAIDIYKNKNLVDLHHFNYRSLLKNRLFTCNSNGYRYIQILEDEYRDRPEVVLSKIKHIFGKDDMIRKIPGRKCDIIEISKDEAEMFLDKNHIQGFVGSTIHLGALYNGEIVGVMSFLNEGENKWNLTRFASLNGCICQGIGGKLFKYFVRKYDPFEIRSFADKRWTLSSDNNVYTKLGFKLEYSTPPGYYYANMNSYERIRRERFKKDKLSKKYGLPMTMTELEMANAIGYGRIWDCGLFKYIWKKEDN